MLYGGVTTDSHLIFHHCFQVTQSHTYIRYMDTPTLELAPEEYQRLYKARNTGLLLLNTNTKRIG
jgi:hypothetical protein